MKILLLTDVPPCDNLTGGLVLSAMVRFVRRDAICCFVVANPTLHINTTAEFANIPMRFEPKPNESWSWLPKRRLARKFSALVSYVGETLTDRFVVRKLTKQAVDYGREQKVDRVWAVLQGQTTIRMAKAIADKLDVPLYTHVWDPFSWWAKANRINGVTTRQVQAQFNDAIAASAYVATASQPMADMYRDQFGVPSIPVISSHSDAMAQSPDLDDDGTSPIVIGMAGQFYAASEWVKLREAMEAANWRIASRPARIVVMGPQRPPGGSDKHISFLGWKSQPDAALILSQCDILYCPYPFDPAMKEVSKLSFPSKLVLYLAAGRPVLFHGPDYSAPALYIRQKHCGLVADKLLASDVYNGLERILRDPERYRTMALNAQRAFRDDFTLRSMGHSFNTFIGASDATGQPGSTLYDHSVQDGSGHFVQPGLTQEQRNHSTAWIGYTIARNAYEKYGRFRHGVKSFITSIALRVPRFYALYTEIKSLYVERDALKETIARLADANLELKRALEEASLNALGGEDALAQRQSLIAAQVVSPDILARRHPSRSMLVAVSASTKSSPQSYGSAWEIYLSVGSIDYASIPGYRIAREQTSGGGETSAAPTGAVAALVRFLLQRGYERIVIAGDGADVALALAAAQLAGVAVTWFADYASDLSAIASFEGRQNLDVMRIEDGDDPKT